MSYSRWSNSYWYTFWGARAAKDTRNTATFCICDFTDANLEFTAAELRENMDVHLSKVKKEHPDGDLEELKRYMIQFLADVDKDFPKEEKMYKYNCPRVAINMECPQCGYSRAEARFSLDTRLAHYVPELKILTAKALFEYSVKLREDNKHPKEMLLPEMLDYREAN